MKATKYVGKITSGGYMNGSKLLFDIQIEGKVVPVTLEGIGYQCFNYHKNMYGSLAEVIGKEEVVERYHGGNYDRTYEPGIRAGTVRIIKDCPRFGENYQARSIDKKDYCSFIGILRELYPAENLAYLEGTDGALRGVKADTLEMVRNISERPEVLGDLALCDSGL